MRNWVNGFTIRARITAGTLAIGLVVSAIAGLILYADVASIIHSSTIELLQNDLAALEVAVKRAPTDPDTRAGEGQLAALISPAGKAVDSNLPDSLKDRLDQLSRLPRGAHSIGSASHRYLVMTEAIPSPDGVWTAIVARSRQPGDLVLGRLGTTLLVGTLALFVSFGFASWILSGAALRPVSRMRREAERLGGLGTTGMLPVGTARDELAALAVTLNEFLDRNRQSIDRERQMVSDASHELRTPLAVLIAQLDEASRIGGSRTEQLRALANASETAGRLSRLTTNLLELSKLDAAGLASDSAWSELANELARSTDRARILAQSKTIEVDFEVADSDGAGRFDVSAANFGRLIDNLLMNSIAASPEDGVVHTTMSMAGSNLRLAVVDGGTGVPENFIPIAFDRFSRASVVRSTHDSGSGLGLAIVAAIVRQAHGSIEMRNQRPGLVVQITIPANNSGL
jgi:two-component system, OmpR family, sensor kinase